MVFRTLILSCFFLPLFAAPQPPIVQNEMQKIDSMGANPEARLAVISAIADALNVHRNHLILLRKETGQTFAQIFAQALEREGLREDAILKRMRAVEADIRDRLALSRGGEEPGPARLRPTMLLNTETDHNSAGTFLSINPEIGVDSKRLSFIAGVPFYKDLVSGTSLSGVGDVYATASLYGRASRVDLATSFTLGLPSGDKGRGLGAGKTTAGVSGAIALRSERIRPFVSAGFANSTFNFAYQRPYIADGNAAQFSGGADARIARRVTIGASGFAVVPSGPQVVYSRIDVTQPSTPPASSNMGGSSGPMGGMGGMGGGSSNTTPPSNTSQMQANAPAHMPFLASTGTSVSASELQDYGATAWAAVRVAPGIVLSFAAARSVPFQLTTVRVSVGLDLARLLLPSKVK